MMFCLDVPAVVDRVEDAVAVVEIAGSTLDLPGAAPLREGDVLRLCVADGARAPGAAAAPAAPARVAAPPRTGPFPAPAALTQAPAR